MAKLQDEANALQTCQKKVREKKLPMEVIDAEYQWWVASCSAFDASPYENVQGPTQTDILLYC